MVEVEKVHKSHSGVQQDAERVVLTNLNTKEGLNLSPSRIEIGERSYIDIDGLDRENRVICEVYAHVGKAKGAQLNKVRGDILRIIATETALGSKWRKIFAVLDSALVSQFGSDANNWTAFVAKKAGIEVLFIDVGADLRMKVSKAQGEQKEGMKETK